MDFAIFTCRLTLDLTERFGAEYGVCTALEKYKRVDRRTNAATYADRAALPGFVFAPIHRSCELRQRVPEHYNLRPMWTKDGHHHTVSEEELRSLQFRLNAEHQRLHGDSGDGAQAFNVGQLVLVQLHPLQEERLLATVAKFRSQGKVRVKLVAQGVYVELPRFLLQPAP